jgi:hypothetical protein
MKKTFLFIFLTQMSFLIAQTATNSSGSGNFNNTATWTSPKDLTGTANVLTGHTITVPINNTVYSDKVTFTGSAKMVLTNSTSKWMASTIMNPSPAIESINIQNNWVASSVYINDAFGVTHNTPWIDSGQAWSAGTANSGTDYLQYDLKSPRWVQGIVTQGRANADQWVTSAKVEVSPDNINWITVFSSQALNSDRNTKVYTNFPKVMYARYVRVTPIGILNYASMRLGIVLRDAIFKSCKEIIDHFPNATSGVYKIDSDGTAGAQAATTCYCDMTTDGGGWTLVLNYLHAGGATPALVTKTTALPLQGSTTLGTDESASATTWGHVSNAYLNSFTFSELRFYGATNAHSRIINFKTTHSGTINYFKTGSGSMTGIASSYTALSGHTAYLPASTASYFTDQGNAAMTEFPFWLGGTYHWGIRGSAYRWEVDDFNNSYNYHTFHQIWIR